MDTDSSLLSSLQSMEMGSDHLGYLSFVAVGAILLFCLIRYTNRCYVGRHHLQNRSRPSADEFTARYFASGSPVSHFVVNENRIPRLVIARVNNPRQLMGYVLNVDVLPQAELPPYAEAIKPQYAPPKYEEQSEDSANSSSSIQSLQQFLADSMLSTARLGSETSSPKSGNKGESNTDSQSRDQHVKYTGRALEVDNPWFNLAAMRRLLPFLALIGTSLAFPMCTDGQTPLMETNDAFTCDRGCPVGFNCEFQDADHTMAKAICCPNITALQQLYGDEEHSEPIWDLSEVASLAVGLDSAPGGTGETTLSTRRIMADDDGVTTVPQYQQPTAVTASSSAEKMADASMEEHGTSTTEENTVKPTTGSYEEIRNMEEIDQSLTLLEPMQEVSSTFPSVSVVVEIEGSGDIPEEPIQKKSCARQKYSIACRNGTVKTQATIRWWKNSETGDCEYYPFGYCPGDRIIESVTIRTKAECEMSCHAGKKNQENSLPKDDEMKGPDGLTEENSGKQEETLTISNLPSLNTSASVTISPETIGKIAIESTNTIDDPKSEKRQENIAIDPVDPTLLLNVVAEPSPPGMSPMDFETTTDMTVSLETKDLFSAVQQENLEHLSPLNLQSGEEDNTSTKRVHPPLIIVQEKISSGTQLDKKGLGGISSEDTLTQEKITGTENVNGDNLNDRKTSEESSNLLAVGEEKSDSIQMRLEPSEKVKVVCDASSYRYSCLNGHPSQFVYRWEMVDGVCQSFAYGYCYGEMNLPHPRTQEECLLYCKPKTHRVLSL